MSPRPLLLLISLTVAVPAAMLAMAAGPIPDRAVLAERAARRFPQPVRVGDLIGRDVLRPVEAQNVIGRVDAIVKRPDGQLDLVMRYGGVLGFGSRLIVVPLDAAALMGEHVAMLELTEDQLDALPAVAAPSGALAPATMIRMALVKPFH